jgi:hypothetical protein
MRPGVLILLLVLAPAARARPVISGKASLTGMYYAEQERLPAGEAQPTLASPWQLAMGDLRLLFAGLGLAREHLDLRLDLRLRGTGTFDFEEKFQPGYAAGPATQVSARGYLGGPEYDLREASFTLWFARPIGLQLGRMFVTEADALKVDAVRIRVRLGRNFEGSLFGGGHPNPSSRSLASDYSPPCGSGVADPSGTAPCVTPGPQLAVAAGATARYQYPWIWGHAGVVGAYFDAAAAGPVRRMASAQVSNLAPDTPGRAAPRVYLAWTNHLSPHRRLDLFTELVLDLFGPRDLELRLTRALVAGHLRLLRDDRLGLRLAYAYMSSLAIEMYLARMLYNRLPNGTTLGGQGVVENNLTVLRTGRHEVRLDADLRTHRRLTLFLTGRLRQRHLLDGDTSPAVYLNRFAYNPDAPVNTSLAGDATAGVRDGGSYRTLRGLLSYTFLRDFRATSHVVRASLGGDPVRDRLALDVEYVALVVTDAGVGQAGCAAKLDPPLGQPASRLGAAGSFFAPDCFGRREGVTHEAGLTLTANPWRRLLLLADYRFTIMNTSPQRQAEVPTVLGHSVLARAEVGF